MPLNISKHILQYERFAAWSQYVTLAGWIAMVLLAAWSIPRHF
jgi:hypothetical protein